MLPNQDLGLTEATEPINIPKPSFQATGQPDNAQNQDLPVEEMEPVSVERKPKGKSGRSQSSVKSCSSLSKSLSITSEVTSTHNIPLGHHEELAKIKLLVLYTIQTAYGSFDDSHQENIRNVMKKFMLHKISWEPDFLNDLDKNDLEYYLFHPLAFKALSLVEIQNLLPELNQHIPQWNVLLGKLCKNEDDKSTFLIFQKDKYTFEVHEDLIRIDKDEADKLDKQSDESKSEHAKNEFMASAIIKSLQEKLLAAVPAENREWVLSLIQEEKKDFYNYLIKLHNTSWQLTREDYARLNTDYTKYTQEDNINKFAYYLKLCAIKSKNEIEKQGVVAQQGTFMELYNKSLDDINVKILQKEVLELEIELLKSSLAKPNALARLYRAKQFSDMELFHEWEKQKFDIETYKENKKYFIVCKHFSRIASSSVEELKDLFSIVIKIFTESERLERELEKIENEFRKINNPSATAKKEFENCESIKKQLNRNFNQVFHYLNKLENKEIECKKSRSIMAQIDKNNIDTLAPNIASLRQTLVREQCREIKVTLQTLPEIELDLATEDIPNEIAGSNVQKKLLHDLKNELSKTKALYEENLIEYTKRRRKTDLLSKQEDLRCNLEEAREYQKICESARRDCLEIYDEILQLMNATEKSHNKLNELDQLPSKRLKHEGHKFAIVTNKKFRDKHAEIREIQNELYDITNRILDLSNKAIDNHDLETMSALIIKFNEMNSKLKAEIKAWNKKYITLLDNERESLNKLFKNVRDYILVSDGHIQCPVPIPNLQVSDTSDSNQDPYDQMADYINQVHNWANKEAIMVDGKLDGITEIDECETREKTKNYCKRVCLEKLQKVTNPDFAHRERAYQLTDEHTKNIHQSIISPAANGDDDKHPNGNDGDHPDDSPNNPNSNIIEKYDLIPLPNLASKPPEQNLFGILTGAAMLLAGIVCIGFGAASLTTGVGAGLLIGGIAFVISGISIITRTSRCCLPDNKINDHENHKHALNTEYRKKPAPRDQAYMHAFFDNNPSAPMPDIEQTQKPTSISDASSSDDHGKSRDYSLTSTEEDDLTQTTSTTSDSFHHQFIPNNKPLSILKR